MIGDKSPYHSMTSGKKVKSHGFAIDGVSGVTFTIAALGSLRQAPRYHVSP